MGWLGPHTFSVWPRLPSLALDTPQASKPVGCFLSSRDEERGLTPFSPEMHEQHLHLHIGSRPLGRAGWGAVVVCFRTSSISAEDFEGTSILLESGTLHLKHRDQPQMDKKRCTEAVRIHIRRFPTASCALSSPFWGGQLKQKCRTRGVTGGGSKAGNRRLDAELTTPCALS